MKYFKLFSKESFFSTQNLHYYYKNKHFFYDKLLDYK